MARTLPHKEEFENIPESERILFAEHLRERIYSTLTLLAVVVALWQHSEEHTPLAVIGIISDTVRTQNTALKAYRDSIRDLIKAIREATKPTETTEEEQQ